MKLIRRVLDAASAETYDFWLRRRAPLGLGNGQRPLGAGGLALGVLDVLDEALGATRPPEDGPTPAPF